MGSFYLWEVYYIIGNDERSGDEKGDKDGGLITSANGPKKPFTAWTRGGSDYI